jgi:hypothetical protein
MKKQKNYYKKFWIIISSILFILLWVAFTYANLISSKELPHFKATENWWNWSITEFTVNWTQWTANATQYVNKENNSSIIGNYLKWYYYDSVYWFFKLDWSNDESKNVRIINSTDKCNGYWYKLWWYAYSENFWFIDFSYDNNTFVYYCVWEWSWWNWKLHWFAYMPNIWFQNFEWIEFDIKPEVTTKAAEIQDDSFVNDTTEITKPEFENDIEAINWNAQYLNDRKWSIFYIIK